MRLSQVARTAELAVEVVMAASATAYLVNGRGEVMVLWEVVSVGYLLAGWATAWRQAGGQDTVRLPSRSSRSGAWALPLLASAVGFACAFNALQVRAHVGTDDSALLMALLASAGVIISWLLLHLGFANIYEIVCSRHRAALVFPDSPRPARIDFLYLSVAVGTSFTTSDVTVRSRLVRRVVVVHSIVSFFYNALVVAVAFQVLQQVLAR